MMFFDAQEGNLHFETHKDQYGDVTVSLRLRDDGGTDSGGLSVDVSPTAALGPCVRSASEKHVSQENAPRLLAS